MMAEAPAEKKEAPLSYEEAVQIAKDAGMSSSDIARCQRLAALSQDEFEAELVQGGVPGGVAWGILWRRN
jgi:hypothetical protein